MGFTIALLNVLKMLFYIVPAFIICKMGLAKKEHIPTLSAVLIYIGTPFLEISAFLSIEKSTMTTLNMGLFFLTSLILQAVFMAAMYFITFKRRNESFSKILTIGSVMGNVGFFGIPIMRALLPNNPEVAAYAAMYTISMNLIVFTFGTFCVTGDRKYMSLRSAVFNPSVLGLVIGLPLYFLGGSSILPSFIVSACDTMGSFTAPLCMFILGIRLASTPLKKILKAKKVLIIVAMKLIVFPVFCFLATTLIPFDYSFKVAIVILSATPCAAIVQSICELHGVDAELPAYSILITTCLCFITIPLMTFLV